MGGNFDDSKISLLDIFSFSSGSSSFASVPVRVEEEEYRDTLNAVAKADGDLSQMLTPDCRASP